MIEFLRRLFGQPGSSATAKDRLRLVLMTDHLELAPEMVSAMKQDLVDVISRYVEVDRERIEVTFERQDRALAMLANIPIVSVNRPANHEVLTNGAQSNGTTSNGTTSNGAASAKKSAEKSNGTPPTRKRRRKSSKKKSASSSPTLPGTASAAAAAQ